MTSTKDIVSFCFIAIATFCFCFVSSFSSSQHQLKQKPIISSSSSVHNNHHIESVSTSLLESSSNNNDNIEESLNSRRSFIGTLWKSLFVGTAGTAVANHDVANAADTIKDNDNTEQEDVYFGVGCFWHIQHEFLTGEQVFLQRTKTQLTSKTGYAGGTKADTQNRVCYHNILNVADYGKLGHGEVVGMTIPTNKILDFTTLYFTLFNPKTKDRVDPMDRGSDYRSLIGFPGGMNHPLYTSIEDIANKAGFKLVAGKGNDPDTIGTQIVYVYDTALFPFYQAEIYHQYHNDFQDKPYGIAYNKLADAAFEDGRLKITGCPDRV